MTARTAHRLRGAGLALAALLAAAAIAMALAALAVPAHAAALSPAEVGPAPARRASGGPDALESRARAPVVAPAGTQDTAEAARRIAWPVGVLAVVTVAALALGVAGRGRAPRLARLARGTTATTAGAGAAIGSAVLDTLLAGGSPAAVAAAVIATILAFWRARRPDPGLPLPAPGGDRASAHRGQRGAAAGPLLVIMACASITAGAMGAWSCTGGQRRRPRAADTHCTAAVLAEHASAREDVGCAAAGAPGEERAARP